MRSSPTRMRIGPGPPRSLPGACSGSPSATWASSAMSPAWMSSSWAAAPPTRPAGWPDATPDRSAWTSPRNSWPPRLAASSASGWRSPLLRPTPNTYLADESFDLVVSEYGASVWCRPDRWVAEAARLLRPGGRLIFVTNSVLATLCVPAEQGFAQERLMRPQRGLHRVEWPGGGVEFHP